MIKICKHRLMLLLCCMTLGGCQSLWQPTTLPESAQDVSRDCVFVTKPTSIPESDPSLKECSMHMWLSYWQTKAQQSWRERKVELAKLTNSRTDQLRGFLLAQPTDTPYQNRLRAQLQFESLQSLLSADFAQLLRELAYEPSQQLLEYESAISILSEVNTRQTKRIEEQAQLLQEQEEKLNQLLSIEAKILENTLEQ
ncbi:hypothetical protein QTP81_05025 [Alteromonas sp. ASW11-36]|uniref:Two-component system QseEF-associated lipoprotein QseG n=1 Tax=Alteromonas arenosi TaxID=3055817 RepID=A0ABT7SUV8_9ALTE|nr:hypothetical protein [Alteromonas sp. ASW11-36]MDM7859955.1 hypothetical protein [Alteromonas sp. ASW11-36]